MRLVRAIVCFKTKLSLLIQILTGTPRVDKTIYICKSSPSASTGIYRDNIPEAMDVFNCDFNPRED